MTNIFNVITSYNLTPNQTYLLYSIREKIPPKLINVQQEIRTLTPEWITSNTTLSSKAIEFLEEIDTYNVFTNPTKEKTVTSATSEEYFQQQVELYRSCFPQGKLPSGVPARTPVQELMKRFIKFFKIFPNYTWETIIAATERYVGEYAMNNYLYMKTASYFIFKQDNEKNVVYTLASYCDMVLSGEPEENEYYSITVK